MGKTGITGLRRILHATRYSAQGFLHAWRHEAAFRQELLLTAVMLPLAVWIGRNAFEVLLLCATLFLVLIVELLNSAIEATVDRVGQEHHELSGRAKDLGSAAVCLSLFLVGVSWGTVAWLRFGAG
jgi:diacylglycerol kinase (ATP)